MHPTRCTSTAARCQREEQRGGSLRSGKVANGTNVGGDGAGESSPALHPGRCCGSIPAAALHCTCFGISNPSQEGMLGHLWICACACWCRLVGDRN